MLSWQETALTRKHDHKIIGENRATSILEGSHMLDSGVKSDSIALEVDEIHTAGGLQNKEISDLDKVIVNHLIGLIGFGYPYLSYLLVNVTMLFLSPGNGSETETGRHNHMGEQGDNGFGRQPYAR
jgi:hypothetical protein